MTKHTSLAIALTATTFLSAPAIAASLTPTLGENSVFSYSEGSENDHNFIVQEADVQGRLTTKYHTIKLKSEKFATHDTVQWREVAGTGTNVVAVPLPNGGVRYFRYSYNSADYNSAGKRTLYTSSQSKLSNVDADFIGAYIEGTSPHGGALINPKSDVTGDFINNFAEGSIDVYGGALYNYSSATDNVTGNFIGNHIEAESKDALGGAIYNVTKSTIGKINGSFIGNYSKDNSAYGGGIYNRANSKIDDITGDFIGNYSLGKAYAQGGAIYNKDHSTIGNVKGDFIGNFLRVKTDEAFGGAVFNHDSSIYKSFTGNFIGNYTQAESTTKETRGGAIYNSKNSTIGFINGHFINNHIANTFDAFGGAIYNKANSEIGNITGNFVGNYARSGSGLSTGGAIYDTEGILNDITGDFIGNYAASTSGKARGGAIAGTGGTAEKINGNFFGNYAVSSDNQAYGGAIYNDNITMGNITGDFIGNYSQSKSLESYGGAVYTNKDMTFTSGGKERFFSGNHTQDKRGKVYNAVYGLGTPVVTFDTGSGGAWVINDNIEGGNYTFKGNDTIDASTGTTTQYVAMNNDIVNATNVKVEGTTLRFGSYQHEDQTAKNWDGKGAFVASLNEDGTANRDAAAVTNLSLNNGVFDIANGYLETVKLKSYSATDSFLHIDVDVENMKADELHIAGNVEGVTKMIVHASSNSDIRNRGQILFAQSENDTTGNAGSFVVSRVYKSPYLFDVKYDQIADNSNKWFFEMNDQDNPDKEVEPEEPDVPDVPTPPTPELPDIPSVKPQPLPGSDRPVAPEVIGAESLPAAALAQNSNMVYNIMNKVSANRLYCPGCGFYDYYWNGEAFHNLWANAVYNTLRIKTPTDIDAEVWGLEAGGDLQHDLNNKLGLFLSYRKGNYDMNGDGKHHYSTIGSEIDIDSYLAGLYYRYDRNHWWTFATVYGGIQRVDLKTKDGIKSDTDGTEFGGSIELGYDYALNKTVYLTPSIGAFYTQVDYDDATDSAGKVAKYNTLRQLELEAGVKLTKAFVMDEGYANLYVKPSVVQTVTDGDEVRITGLGKVNTIDDQTLGRIEISGRYGFTEQLSAYGWANHTFGDDYKASTFGLGLSYSW